MFEFDKPGIVLTTSDKKTASDFDPEERYSEYDLTGLSFIWAGGVFHYSPYHWRAEQDYFKCYQRLIALKPGIYNLTFSNSGKDEGGHPILHKQSMRITVTDAPAKEEAASSGATAKKKETLTVKVDKKKTTKVTLKKGKTAKVKAVHSLKKKVTYSTSNKKIATVSSAGKIKAVKKGTATITVKAGTKKVKIKVTVK